MKFACQGSRRRRFRCLQSGRSTAAVPSVLPPALLGPSRGHRTGTVEAGHDLLAVRGRDDLLVRHQPNGRFVGRSMSSRTREWSYGSRGRERKSPNSNFEFEAITPQFAPWGNRHRRGDPVLKTIIDSRLGEAGGLMAQILGVQPRPEGLQDYRSSKSSRRPLHKSWSSSSVPYASEPLSALARDGATCSR